MNNQFNKWVRVLLICLIPVHFLGFIYQFVFGFVFSGLALTLDSNYPSFIYFPLLSALSLLSIYFLFAILNFKKFGFWGFIITQIMILFISLLIRDWTISIVYGFFFAIALFAVQIDKKKKIYGHS